MTLHDLLQQIARRRAEYAEDILEGRVSPEGLREALARLRTLDEVVEMTRPREENRREQS